MAEATGLAPAAQVEHLVKAAFATRWSPVLSGLYDTLISCSGTLILEHEPCKSILLVRAAWSKRTAVYPHRLQKYCRCHQ